MTLGYALLCFPCAVAISLMATPAVVFVKRRVRAITRSSSRLGGLALYQQHLCAAPRGAHAKISNAWANTYRLQQDLRLVLRDAGMSDVADEVIDVLKSGDQSVCARGGLPIGGRLEWMAYRRGGNSPTVLRMVQWGGAAPIKAFEFEVQGDNRELLTRSSCRCPLRGQPVRS